MTITTGWFLFWIIVFTVMFCVIIIQGASRGRLESENWRLKQELREVKAALDQRTKETHREIMERILAKVDPAFPEQQQQKEPS